jgi:hypothetical protein
MAMAKASADGHQTIRDLRLATIRIIGTAEQRVPEHGSDAFCHFAAIRSRHEERPTIKIIAMTPHTIKIIAAAHHAAAPTLAMADRAVAAEPAFSMS